jgi:protein-L-isoaspartate(D-aspartate) O-methyltransferase
MTGRHGPGLPGRARNVSEAWSSARAALVASLRRRPELDDEVALRALEAVPRELFVPEPHTHAAYEDRALPIERDQTISQPYMVALMTQLAQAGPGRRILEVGTGSGYQTAVLAATGAEVFSVELDETLAQISASRLSDLGYSAHTRAGDGHRGWPEAAPFDAILVTAAPEEVPRALLEQLAPGGRLVIPVGPPYEQELLLLTRSATGITQESVTGVRFVPMRGTAFRFFRGAHGV